MDSCCSITDGFLFYQGVKGARYSARGDSVEGGEARFGNGSKLHDNKQLGGGDAKREVVVPGLP